MLYDLGDSLSLGRFRARVDLLTSRGSVVELTDRSRRSVSQNSYLHCILAALALETGNTLETVKREIYKRRVNPDLFVSVRRDPVLGEVETLRSSRDLDKEEMSLSIDRYKRFCAENGVYIPEPGDGELLRQIEMEAARAAKWL